MVGVMVSSRGSVMVILLEWDPLHHPNMWTINSFHSLTPRNLLSTTHDWLGELNGELDSELDILYAYLG